MEEDKKDNGGYEAEGNPLVGLIRSKFQQAETSKVYDEKRWLKTIEDYMDLKWHFVKTKSQEYLLK
jgi:hypothetical protein